MQQATFASLSFDAKEEAHPPRAVPERNGPCGAVDGPGGADRAALSDRRPTRPPAEAPLDAAADSLLQPWYALSDPAMEEALYQIESMRRFAGIELNQDALPDETTILTFRRLLR